MSAKKPCPKCDYPAMVPGRRRDEKDAFSTTQEAWLPGCPEHESLGWFRGAQQPLEVVTYACPQCGALTSYVDATKIPDNLEF